MTAPGNGPTLDRPRLRLDTRSPWRETPQWTCRWLHPPDDWQPPWVAFWSCNANLDSPKRLSIRVSADERYQLFLNGVPVGAGPERGVRECWFFETYTLELPAGNNCLSAVTWALGGKLAPWAQQSVRPGLLVAPVDPCDDALLGTGRGRWTLRRLPGITFVAANTLTGHGMGSGPGEVRDMDEWLAGHESGPIPVELGAYGNDGMEVYVTKNRHYLRPSMTPAPLQKHLPQGRVRHADTGEGGSIVTAAAHSPSLAHSWTRLWEARSALTVPADSRVRALLDLDDYACHYPSLRLGPSAGAVITLRYGEAMLDADGRKGHRDEVEERRMFPFRDVVRASAARHVEWRPLWWRCGRYVEIEVSTGPEPLHIEGLSFIETRHPAPLEATWACDNRPLDRLLRLCLRTLEVGAHDTFHDSPYWEQLMYSDDARTGSRCRYALSRDTTLPRKYLELFDLSRINLTGLTTANYPSRDGQIIPPFSLHWVLAVNEYAWWRGDPEFVQARMPGVRAVLEIALHRVGKDGLFRSLDGWNYFDWCWEGGVPPGGQPGEVSSILNLHLVLALRAAADLEAWIGEPECAARWSRRAAEVIAAVRRHCWRANRGLIADTVEGNTFSEHAQALGVLAGFYCAQELPTVREAFSAKPNTLHKSALAFGIHLFDAWSALDCPTLIWDRLGDWFSLAGCGLKTTPEIFKHPRSDAHPFTAHPAFHYFATLLGIRPASYGFSRVRVAPWMPPQLDRLAGAMPHPHGEIRVDIVRNSGEARIDIELPDGVVGELVLNGSIREIASGATTHSIESARS